MRTGGRSEHNCIIGGTFRKAKYEIRRRRKSEGGQKFLPPNPLPFCPPERGGKRKLYKLAGRAGFELASSLEERI